MPVARRVFLLSGLGLLSGCSVLSRQWHVTSGQLGEVASRQPIMRAAYNPTTDERVGDALRQAIDIRRFCLQQLHLVDNDSFQTVAGADAMPTSWELRAVPELSLDLKPWCGWLSSCLNVREFYSFAAAERAAMPLRDQGYEVDIAPRWFGRLNARPTALPRALVDWPVADLAWQIVHELALQTVRAGDDGLRAGFAVATANAGQLRWLSQQDSALAEQARDIARRRDALLGRLVEHRGRLDALYASSISAIGKRERKREILAAAEDDLRTAPSSVTGGRMGWSRWLTGGVNGAGLAAINAAPALVPEFDALLIRQRGDFRAYVMEAGRLAQEPVRVALASLRGGDVAARTALGVR